MKPNLVIVRAGKSSLHSHWLTIPYQSRNFDTIISYFDSEAFEDHKATEGVRAVLQTEGGKWDNIFKCLTEFEWSGYSRFWFPDDDVLIDGANVHKLFEIAEANNLALCQPALTADSFITYFTLVGVDGFERRHTCFIEVMAPCLKADVLKEVLDLFPLSPSGFGLDKVWGRLAVSGVKKTAIVDAVRMRHTRPVGSVLGKTLLKAGRDAELDAKKIYEKFEAYDKTRDLIAFAVKNPGGLVNNRIQIAVTSCRSWISNRSQFIDSASVMNGCIRTLKRALIYRQSFKTLVRKS